MYIDILNNNNIELLPIICKTSYYYYLNYWKKYRNINSPKELEILYKKTFINNYNKNDCIYIIFLNQDKNQDKNNIVGFGITVDNDFTYYKKRNNNSIFLSDLFIFRKYRHMGYGRESVNYIIHKILTKNKNTSIYISGENNEKLLHFYKNIKFYKIDKYVAEKEYFILEYLGTSKM